MRSLARTAGLAAALMSLALAPLTGSADPCPAGQRIPLDYSITPEHPCDGDSVFFNVTACGPCVDIITVGDYLGLHVVAKMDAGACIERVCEPERMSIAIGQFSAGNHQFLVEVTGEIVRGDSICTVAYADSFGFRVGRCPPPGLPYVDDIIVGQRVVCVTTPCPDLACPGDSIPVFVRGTFPDDCHSLRSIKFLPKIDTAIGPPTLQILIDDGGCLGRPCTTVPVPWSAEVKMPPLPPGPYRLPIQLGIASCTDSFPRDSVYRALHAFHVVDAGAFECANQLPCFTVAWTGRDILTEECDAVVTPGHPGRLLMTVAPRVDPLAGLQGDLVLLSERLDQVVRPGLRITGITTTGPAVGMHLQWRPTEQGASFVLFTDDTSEIPVWPPPNVRVADPALGWPVLIVTVEQTTNVADARHSLSAVNLLGSTHRGRRVDECPRRGLPPRAIICTGARCDMNGDGASDVRDLVLMVNCVMRPTLPPWPTVCGAGMNVDCDGNGQFTMEDVMCCARFILRGTPNDSLPNRPEPGIAVDLGDITRVDRTYELPVVVRGAERMGAARLALSFPADRFEVSAVEVDGGAGWLSLHEVRDGQVVVGLISTAGEPGSPEEVRMTVRFTLKSGQVAGGRIGLVEGEFSGRDGVGLAVQLGQPSRGLGPVSALSLTASQPNPFSRTTQFTVVLEADGALDVGVYDLGGRRVASLYRGAASVGRRDLEWNGRMGDGSAAPSGVYFLKAEMGGDVVSRRIVLLRD